MGLEHAPLGWPSAEGNASAAIDLALDAARRAEESGQRAIEMLALHDAVRFGDMSSLQLLIDLATGVGGRLAAAIAAHATAMRRRSWPPRTNSTRSARCYQRPTPPQAACAFATSDDRRGTVEAAAVAHRLAAECAASPRPPSHRRGYVSAVMERGERSLTGPTSISSGWFLSYLAGPWCFVVNVHVRPAGQSASVDAVTEPRSAWPTIWPNSYTATRARHLVDVRN